MNTEELLMTTQEQSKVKKVSIKSKPKPKNIIIVEEEAPVIIEPVIAKLELETLMSEDDEAEEQPLMSDDDEAEEAKAQLKRYQEILDEIQAKKKVKEAKKNISELRQQELDYISREEQSCQNTIDNLIAKKNLIHKEYEAIERGEFDDELIAREILKAPKEAPIKIKAKGEAKEKTEPTCEGKGKKAGTGDARVREIADLNSGKYPACKLTYAKKVGNNTWSLMKSNLVIVKDSEGVYAMPLFKELGDLSGFYGKTKQDFIDWVKDE